MRRYRSDLSATLSSGGLTLTRWTRKSGQHLKVQNLPSAHRGSGAQPQVQSVRSRIQNALAHLRA
eukprot:4706209-Pyramimonas_sp.AAC.1